jgi:hypothetical protein
VAESSPPRRKITLALGDGAGSTTAGVGRRQVDICFVFDTTGSMSDKIDGLITCMVDFVRELSTLALDWRISVVPFGDLTIPGDRIVADNPFVDDRAKAEQQLRAMPRNSGGGNLGESSIEAIEAALAKPYRSEAVKMLILLTDEPALTHNRTPEAVKQQLLQREFMLFALAVDLPYFREWAKATGGSWYPIGQAVDMNAILAVLRELAAHLAQVANKVHALAGGSVKQYLELEQGK